MAAFIAIDADGTVRPEGQVLDRLRSYSRSFLRDPRQVLGWHLRQFRIGRRIPISVLRAIERSGHRVMVIGAEWLQSYGFDGLRVRDLPISGLSYGKSRALREWRAAFPGYDRYIVVDDRPEQYGDGWAGWEMMLPGQFLARAAELVGPTR